MSEMSEISKKIYRQGDVLLIEDVLPAKAKIAASLTVALGEATGHHHTLTSGQVMVADDLMWVVAEPGTVLTHQEHDHITIDPGVYRVVIQREYTPAAPRRVMD